MTKADETAKMLALLQAEQKARERDRALAHHGRLWGAWTPDRLLCRSCGEYLVDPEQQAAFLDLDEVFNVETKAARATVVFDLKHRKSMTIPEWVVDNTELLRDTQGLFADLKPDEITMMATVEGLNGRFGEYSRACDGASHIFVRACPHCSDSDPLNLCAELMDKGLTRVTPPHSFLDVLRADEEARRTREEHTNKTLLNGLLKEEKAQTPSNTLPKPDGDDCPKCGSKTKRNAKFCGMCGYRLRV